MAKLFFIIAFISISLRQASVDKLPADIGTVCRLLPVLRHTLIVFRGGKINNINLFVYPELCPLCGMRLAGEKLNQA